MDKKTRNSILALYKNTRDITRNAATLTDPKNEEFKKGVILAAKIVMADMGEVFPRLKGEFYLIDHDFSGEASKE